jgi:hypothetical protein
VNSRLHAPTAFLRWNDHSFQSHRRLDTTHRRYGRFIEENLAFAENEMQSLNGPDRSRVRIRTTRSRLAFIALFHTTRTSLGEVLSSRSDLGGSARKYAHEWTKRQIMGFDTFNRFANMFNYRFLWLLHANRYRLSLVKHTLMNELPKYPAREQTVSVAMVGVAGGTVLMYKPITLRGVWRGINEHRAHRNLLDTFNGLLWKYGDTQWHEATYTTWGNNSILSTAVR